MVHNANTAPTANKVSFCEHLIHFVDYLGISYI